MANETVRPIINLTIDEAMQDILAAIDFARVPEVPEGYKSINEIKEASGSLLSRKQFANNLKSAADRGVLDRIQVGRNTYYKAIKK